MGGQDHYKTLAFKTLAFWQLVIEQYNARYIIKVDDDNYVRLDRLAIAVRQWEDIGAGAAPVLAGSAHSCAAAVQGEHCYAPGRIVCLANSKLWRAEYVGCFKIRNAVDARLAQRSHRWYDPHHKVFLGDDTRYAEGPFYVIHGRVIEGIMRSGLLPRAGGPEGAHPSRLEPCFTSGVQQTCGTEREFKGAEGCSLRKYWKAHQRTKL